MLSRLLLVVFLASPHAAAAATLLVLGDSLSAGYGMRLEQGWVSLLQGKLMAEKLDYKVVNASISGETTAGGRTRIEAALRTHRPAIVILALGANDGLRGQNLDAMRANLEAMIRACRQSGARVLLAGMRLPPNYGSTYTERFAQIYADIARKERLSLVPFLLEGFGDKPEYFQADGVHPGTEAQQIILENVWKVLRPVLSVKGR